jgi:hypothetical protein
MTTICREFSTNLSNERAGSIASPGYNKVGVDWEGGTGMERRVRDQRLGSFDDSTASTLGGQWQRGWWW